MTRYDIPPFCYNFRSTGWLYHWEFCHVPWFEFRVTSWILYYFKCRVYVEKWGLKAIFQVASLYDCRFHFCFSKCPTLIYRDQQGKCAYTFSSHLATMDRSWSWAQVENLTFNNVKVISWTWLRFKSNLTRLKVTIILIWLHWGLNAYEQI